MVNLNLYIDPGTGSMLFTVLIGVLSAAVYGARTLFIRLRTGAGTWIRDPCPAAVRVIGERGDNVAGRGHR